jgi:16S rRNA (guanine527-N7)-methyltransferase
LLIAIAYGSLYNFPVPDLSELLTSFVSQALTPQQLDQLQRYLDLLLKWNAKISLTSLRDPEEIVRRHFGESLFASEHLQLDAASTLIDFGSGAGFPGLPMKILAPHLHVTLIESRQKKVTFLREVIRALGLQHVLVHEGRAEQSQLKSQVVTMRAVEKFESALPIAASLLERQGKLGLLIGAAQSDAARNFLPGWTWDEPVATPASRERILLVGTCSA